MFRRLSSSIPYSEIFNNYVNIRYYTSGAYGDIYKANDPSTNEEYRVIIECRIVIKIIHGVFRNINTAISCLREINVLKHSDHPNIPKILYWNIIYRKILKPDSFDSGECVCIIEKDCGTNLQKVIMNSHLINGWCNEHIKFIMYQIFCTLKYLHSNGIIHSDIKPSNILMEGTPKITLIDYGLSHQVIDSNSKTISTYPNGEKKTPIIVTRNYRAPELSLKQSKYDESIDIFSVGCVFYELLQTLQHNNGDKNFKINNLFKSEQDSMIEEDKNIIDILNNPSEHLYQIIHILGKPSKEDLCFIEDENIRNVYII